MSEALGCLEALVVAVAGEPCAAQVQGAALHSYVACERPGVEVVVAGVEGVVEHAVQHCMQAIPHELVGVSPVTVDHRLGIVAQHAPVRRERLQERGPLEGQMPERRIQEAQRHRD